MKFKAFALGMAVCLGGAFCFASCDTETGGNLYDSVNIRAVSPTVGSEVVLANDEILSFARNYEKGNGISEFGKGDRYKMKGVTLAFEADKPAFHYNVCVSLYEDMSDAQVKTTLKTEVHFDDLFVNSTYYWQVYATYVAGTVASSVFSFTTADTPRTIDIEGVSNTRDVGGKKTLDGKKVKQGLVYRAAILDGVTDTGKQKATDYYRIKTEIDFRRANEVGSRTTSPFGESVEFIHISAPYYVGDSNGIDNPDNQDAIRRYIQVFANAGKYPIMFHCSAGRDRTGMAAMLLQGLLGVSEKDIFLDYETSFFSLRGCADGANPSLLITFFTNTVNYIKNNYGETQDTFQRKCELYLLSIGVTETEISAIKTILLEN